MSNTREKIQPQKSGAEGLQIQKCKPNEHSTGKEKGQPKKQVRYFGLPEDFIPSKHLSTRHPLDTCNPDDPDFGKRNEYGFPITGKK